MPIYFEVFAQITVYQNDHLRMQRWVCLQLVSSLCQKASPIIPVKQLDRKSCLISTLHVVKLSVHQPIKLQEIKIGIKILIHLFVKVISTIHTLGYNVNLAYNPMKILNFVYVQHLNIGSLIIQHILKKILNHVSVDPS